jgi:hypothetical protein
MSDMNDLGQRDYGVHLNGYGETFALAEHLLESTGRFGSRKDVISRDWRNEMGW